MLEMCLSESEAASLAEVAHAFGSSDTDLEDHLDTLYVAAMQTLPAHVLLGLRRLRSDPAAVTSILIHNVPVDHDLGATPTDSTQAAGTAPTARQALLMIALAVGEPVGYADEKEGTLVQSIYPVAAEQASPSNESSQATLDLHTELTFTRRDPSRPLHDASPDFLLLHCLRQDPEGAAITTVVEARELCRSMDPDTLEALRQSEFQLQAPHSFTRGGDGSRPWAPPAPLVMGSEWAPEIAFDLACGVRATTEQAGDALQQLREVAGTRDLRIDVKLRTGDLLLVDNRACAHARSPFRARYDGTDRWLHRVYVRRSLHRLHREPPVGSPRTV